MSSWKSHNEVPRTHIYPDQSRPQLEHDEYSEAEIIPLINVAGYRNGDMVAKEKVVAQVRAACLDWGFFQIVDHGFPADLIDRVRHQGLKFFDLPEEIKKKVEKPPGEFTGFGHATIKPGDVQPWAEGFYLSDVSRVDEASRTLWPESYNKDFAASYKEYDEEMMNLSKQLMELVMESLNVSDDTKHFETYLKDGSGLFRWNYYPACPEPHKTLGMNVHTDFTLLTVLHMGHVGGLQVQKGGKWIAVQPRHDAFAVNIGDMIQVLTNGVYKSVPHRAVVNRTDARLSLAYLLMPPPDVEVVAAPELLARDGTEPLYLPFNLENYTKVKQIHCINTLDHFKSPLRGPSLD